MSYGLNKTAVHSISFDPNDAHYVLQLCGHSELELLVQLLQPQGSH